MLNSGNKILALRDKKKYSERNKKPYPPPSPLQVKWSVPKGKPMSSCSIENMGSHINLVNNENNASYLKKAIPNYIRLLLSVPIDHYFQCWSVWY